MQPIKAIMNRSLSQFDRNRSSEYESLPGNMDDLPNFEGRLIWVIVLTIILVGGTSIGVYLLCVEGQELEVSDVPYNYVSRAGWRAIAPKFVRPLKPPATRIMLVHTNTSGCTGDECVKTVKHLQRHYMEELNQSDIPYNFLVSTDGVIYEGRGWEVQSPFQDSSHTISIAFIGNFHHKSPPKLQIEETELLIQECIQWKQLTPCYGVVLNGPLSLSVKHWFDSRLPENCREK